MQAEWVDYNGHLRDAYYALVFSHAVDALMDQIGLDAAGRARHRSSLYTVETQIRYLREVREGQALRVETRRMTHDAKRLRLQQTMFVEDGAEPVATAEQLLLHVDTDGPRAAPFPEPVLERIRELP
ncbi:thioesterase family protein [Pseudaquabacterium terrae]|uniref:thioesterase family protein n=1 Tax=Pseudaquabacterium terrae TaxID=2732868 RepID=UPI003CCDE52C